MGIERLPFLYIENAISTMRYWGLCFVFLCLVLPSCQKRTNELYTIEGRLFTDCSNQPIVNGTIELRTFSQNHGTVDVATTDGDGHFSFTYQGFRGFDVPHWLVIMTGSQLPSTIVEGIPVNENLSLDTIYKGQTIGLLNVHLETANPFTNEDTLYVEVPFSDSWSPNDIVDTFPGPFNNGILREYEVNRTLRAYGSPQKRVMRWVLNDNISNPNSNTHESQFLVYPECGRVDNITITIP